VQTRLRLQDLRLPRILINVDLCFSIARLRRSGQLHRRPEHVLRLQIRSNLAQALERIPYERILFVNLNEQITRFSGIAMGTP
jgi:hypothetical protein